MEKETAFIKISNQTKRRIQEMADERNDTVDDMTEYLVQKGLEAEQEANPNLNHESRTPTDDGVKPNIGLNQAVQKIRTDISEHKLLYGLDAAGVVYISVYLAVDIPIDLSLATGIPLGIGLLVSSSVNIFHLTK